MTEFGRKDYPALMDVADLCGDFSEAARGHFHRQGKIAKFVTAYTPEEQQTLERMERKSFRKFFSFDFLFMSQEQKSLEKEKAVLESLTVREFFARAAARVEDTDTLAQMVPKKMRTEQNAALLEKYNYPVLASLTRIAMTFE